MMKRVDGWLDTKDKRHMAFGCFVLIIVLIAFLPYAWLGYRLLTIQTYEDVFSLLKEPLLSLTYVSRFVLSCLEMGSWSIQSVCINLCKAVNFTECIVLVLWLILSRDHKMRYIRRLFYMAIGTGVVVTLYFTWSGLQATTLMEGIDAMKRIAAVLLLLSAVAFVLHLFALLFIYGYGYHKAMRYTVVEYHENELYRLMQEDHNMK